MLWIILFFVGIGFEIYGDKVWPYDYDRSEMFHDWGYFMMLVLTFLMLILLVNGFIWR